MLAYDKNKFHIYVVSLAKEKARYFRIKQLLDKEGLLEQTTFLPAIEAQYITSNYIKSQNYGVFPDKLWRGSGLENWYTESIKQAEIACCLGHMMGWQAQVRQQYEYALILEDDCYWTEPIVPHIDKWLQFNSNTFSKPHEYGIFYLGRIPVAVPEFERYMDFLSIHKEEYITEEYTRPQFSFNLQSYIMSLNFTKQLLDEHRPEKALMTPDEIIPACWMEHPHKHIRERFPTITKAAALTIPNPNYPENWSIGCTWQDGTWPGITLTNLGNSPAYEY